MPSIDREKLLMKWKSRINPNATDALLRPSVKKIVVDIDYDHDHNHKNNNDRNPNNGE